LFRIMPQGHRHSQSKGSPQDDPHWECHCSMVLSHIITWWSGVSRDIMCFKNETLVGSCVSLEKLCGKSCDYEVRTASFSIIGNIKCLTGNENFTTHNNWDPN
jgi:hypothetical protein